MKGIKAKINIDKLTVCYTATEEVFTELLDTNFADYDTFQLVRYNDPEKLFADSFIIKSKDIDEKNGGVKWFEFARLKFNMKISNKNEDDKHYIWIYFDNRALYTPMYPDVSIITEMEYITDTLRLKINNITSLDIAFDSNINIAKRIKKAIFAPYLSVILNGKLKDNTKEVLEQILYLQKGNQEKMTDLSIYVGQKKKNGLELCIYDKTKDAVLKKKPYILKWMATHQNVYRAEIRLKNQHLKEYFDKEPDFILDMIFSYLNDKSFLFDMFMDFVNRLLRFRDKDNNIYSILEV